MTATIRNISNYNIILALYFNPYATFVPTLNPLGLRCRRVDMPQRDYHLRPKEKTGPSLIGHLSDEVLKGGKVGYSLWDLEYVRGARR